MGALEKFLHGHPVQTPILVKAALAHAQFETIHPFLDGNGRVGRLLITLLLVAEGVLDRPLLYPSLYLKTHRDVYYDYLQRVRTEGIWEEWISFFLDGIAESAESTISTTKAIVELIDTDRQRIQKLGRSANTASLVHDDLTKFIVGRPGEIAKSIGMSEPPVYQALEHLERLGIARETTGRQRGRIYAYDRYLALLNEGTTDPYR
jgi:Fic family protein